MDFKLPNLVTVLSLQKKNKWLRKSPDQLTPGDLLDEHSQRNYCQSFQPKIKNNPIKRLLNLRNS